ncbi:MAG: hypothetical protein K2O14_07405 [Oscillospiraceae bacterium]|nr:hypothetical protein [Oscillospiraceae bacterium]
MQAEKIKERHREWLRKNIGIEFEDIYDMTADERDKFTCRMMEAEVDADYTEDEPLVQEVMEIIYGPWKKV